MCVREITGAEWTPRMLARPHKSWKRHFGVRLRAVDPTLRSVVPRLLDDARARRYLFCWTHCWTQRTRRAVW
jgi:hypothetical protein